MTDQKPQRLPSDALKGPTRRVPWILGGVATAALLVSGVMFGPAVAAQLTPAPTPTATVAPADTVSTLSPEELASVQQGADEQQAIIAADEKAAADAAAAQAAQAAADAAQAAASRDANRQSNPAGLPAGAVVPLNSFGSPDTTKCASGSASDNSAGVAVCD